MQVVPGAKVVPARLQRLQGSMRLASSGGYFFRKMLPFPIVVAQAVILARLVTRSGLEYADLYARLR